MRKSRFLVIPLVLFFLMACSLSNGIQQIKSAVTQLPALLTSAPTALGAVQTLAAGQTSGTDCGTSTPGGLGVALSTPKAVLEYTQQFTFTDSIVDGLPATTATLASAGASTFSSISNGFAAQFIGDPCNLSRIIINAPYTTDQSTVDQGLAVINILFSAIMPLDVQVPLLSWLAQSYSSVPVSGQEQTTIKTMQFTLSRAESEMTLEIVPAP